MSIDVGARLKSVRITFGLSQRALARRAGVTFEVTTGVYARGSVDAAASRRTVTPSTRSP